MTVIGISWVDNKAAAAHLDCTRCLRLVVSPMAIAREAAGLAAVGVGWRLAGCRALNLNPLGSRVLPFCPF